MHNQHIIEKAISSRPSGVPLITVSNHHRYIIRREQFSSKCIFIIADFISRIEPNDTRDIFPLKSHFSCFDDPGMWALLKLSQVCNSSVMRWSLAAHDICFTNKLHSWFFMFGKLLTQLKN